MAYLSESVVEEAALECLDGLGYEVRYGRMLLPLSRSLRRRGHACLGLNSRLTSSARLA
jgi:hypothetical protein